MDSFYQRFLSHKEKYERVRQIPSTKFSIDEFRKLESENRILKIKIEHLQKEIEQLRKLINSSHYSVISNVDERLLNVQKFENKKRIDIFERIIEDNLKLRSIK